MATSTLTDLTGTSGYVTVAWTNAEVPANFYAWRLYHRKTGTTAWTKIYETLTNSASYSINTYAWANAVSQEIILIGVSQNPTTGELTETAYTGANTFTPTGDGKFTLVHPTSPSSTVTLSITTEYQSGDEDEQETILLLGADGEAGHKKINRGTFYGRVGQLGVQIRDHPTYGTATAQKEKLIALRRLGTYVFLRTPFGDLWKVYIGPLDIKHIGGTGSMEACDISFSFEEVG